MHQVPTLVLNHELVQHQDGFWMALGANIRPLQPRELKFAFHTNFFAGDEDITQPVSLSHFNGSDIRDAVGDQGPYGDCAVKSAEQAVITSCNGAGWGLGEIPTFHNGYGYELIRKRENPNSWRTDSGSTLGGNADLLLSPLNVKLSDRAFVPDSTYDYGDLSQLAAQDNLVFLQSHNPIWPDNTLNFMKGIHAALRLGFCVQLGSFWPTAWFNPDQNGIVPDASVNQPMAGGHAYRCWGMLNGWFLCRNQWTPNWNTQVSNFGWDCQPGDFAISWNMALNRPGENQSIIFEARAYVPIAKSQPDPQPPKNTDKYWQWVRRDSYLTSQQPETVRAPQAQLIYTTTKNWYPEVK